MQSPELKIRSTTEQVPTEAEIFRRFGLEFKNEIPHSCGNVPAKLIGKDEAAHTTTMRWGIRQGSYYPPQTHTHGHILIIQHGSGVVSIDGREYSYKTGDVFDIAGNVPHGFIQVDETTIVNQQQPAR